MVCWHTECFRSRPKTVSNLASFINDEGELIDIIDDLVNNDGKLIHGDILDDVLDYPRSDFCQKYYLLSQPETISPELLALYTPSIITEDVIMAAVEPTHTETSERVQDLEREKRQEEKTTTEWFFEESQILPAPTDLQHGNSANVKSQLLQGIKISPALSNLQELKRHSADIAATSSTKGEATYQKKVHPAAAHQEVTQQEAAHWKNAHLKLKYQNATVPSGKGTHAPTKLWTKPRCACQGGRKNHTRKKDKITKTCCAKMKRVTRLLVTRLHTKRRECAKITRNTTRLRQRNRR